MTRSFGGTSRHASAGSTRNAALEVGRTPGLDAIFLSCTKLRTLDVLDDLEGSFGLMVSAYAARLRLTLVTVPADRGADNDAAIEALGLIALRGKVVTSDALHCNRRPSQSS